MVLTGDAKHHGGAMATGDAIVLTGEFYESTMDHGDAKATGDAMATGDTTVVAPMVAPWRRPWCFESTSEAAWGWSRHGDAMVL